MIPHEGVPRSQSTGVPGWRHHPDEENAIIRWAELIVPEHGNIVELGTEYGRGASELAYGCRNKSGVRVLSIDKFPARPEGDLQRIWEANIAEARPLHFPNVRLDNFKGDSAEYGFQLQSENATYDIHLLFIDGGHDLKSVTKDLEAWGPLVVEGGAILVHDYWKNADSHELHKQVKQAVDAWHNPDLWERTNLPGSLVGFVRLANPAHFVEIEPVMPDFDAAFDDENPTEPVSVGHTIKEIAAMRDVSVSTVRKWVKDIEPIGKSGRADVYALEDLPE